MPPKRVFMSRMTPITTGEFMTYTGFAVLSMNWLPLGLFSIAWLNLFVPNMLAKEASMSRHDEWEDWVERSGMFFPYLPTLISEFWCNALSKTAEPWYQWSCRTRKCIISLKCHGALELHGIFSSIEFQISRDLCSCMSSKKGVKVCCAWQIHHTVDFCMVKRDLDSFSSQSVPNQPGMASSLFSKSLVRKFEPSPNSPVFFSLQRCAETCDQKTARVKPDFDDWLLRCLTS